MALPLFPSVVMATAPVPQRSYRYYQPYHEKVKAGASSLLQFHDGDVEKSLSTPQNPCGLIEAISIPFSYPARSVQCLFGTPEVVAFGGVFQPLIGEQVQAIFGFVFPPSCPVSDVVQFLTTEGGKPGFAVPADKIRNGPEYLPRFGVSGAPVFLPCIK